MIEEEVEIVAEELAKVGGVNWYPGRENGPLLRVVSDRYRDRARAAIMALDRFRAAGQSSFSQDNGVDGNHPASAPPPPRDDVRLGDTVIYRPPGERRAYPCRVVQIEGNRAYLAPILRACTDWVSIEHLLPSTPATEGALPSE